MKCANCNLEIRESASYCPFCGQKVEKEKPIKKISLQCEHCSGTLEVEENERVIYCPYCGSKELIIENDRVKIERIRMDAHKEIELEKIKSRDRKLQMEAELEAKEEQKRQAEKFKKGKLFKVLIVAFFICACMTYMNMASGHILDGLLTLIQTGCFGLAWLMGMTIVKERIKYMHILLMILGFVLLIPWGGMRPNDASVKQIKWEIIFMRDKIPEPVSKKIEIHENKERELRIDVYNTSEQEYYEYMIACKEAGYINGIEEYYNSYSAYDEDGYYMEISFYSYNEEMSITAKAPNEIGALNWDSHSISSVLPKPNSEEGTFQKETKDETIIIVGKITSDGYDSYITECKEKGFVIDAEKETDTYQAYDSDGNHVYIQYTSGNKEMEIRFEYPMQFKKIDWPTSGVGKYAPKPHSLSGNVESDYGWCYSVYLENTTREEYEQYIKDCEKAGFNVEKRVYENSYWADYKKDEDISITVSYEGFNIMCVRVQGALTEDY